MAAVLYEFERMQMKKQGNYIFQYVKNRKLTNVYHAHDFYEMVYFLKGSAVQKINGHERVCGENTFVLLRPGDRHCFLSQTSEVSLVSFLAKKQEFELFANAYMPDLVSQICKDEHPRQCENKSLFSLLHSGILDAGFVFNEYDCKFLLNWFLRSYIDDCEKKNIKIPQILLYAADEMKKQENLQKGVLAFMELSHFSHSHLSRLVKQHYGVSLQKYIMEQRLQKAYSEILFTDEEIETVSESVGYASFSHFNKIFKERFGITPAALRKQSKAWTV